MLQMAKMPRKCHKKIRIQSARLKRGMGGTGPAESPLNFNSTTVTSSSNLNRRYRQHSFYILKQLGRMAHSLPRLFTRRVCQSSPASPFLQSAKAFRAPAAPFRTSIARRTYATGESGPNPTPGQSPFKIWPFLAITAVGSVAYVLMVQQRAGAF